MCCVCNKVIDIEHIGESTLKSHMKGEKHKWNAGATSSSTQSVLMATFLRKELVQVVIKARNLVVRKRITMKFLFPRLCQQQMVSQQSSLLTDVKDAAHRLRSSRRRRKG